MVPRGGEGALPGGVFVPDEEAARLIEALLRATGPDVAENVWPGWAPAEGAALLLPDGRGAFTLRVPLEGRPVAGRDGGTIAELAFVDLAEAPPLSRLGGSAPPPGAAGGGAAAEATPLGGRIAVALRVDEPSAPAMADAFHRASFEAWWAARHAARRPPAPEPQLLDPEWAALMAVEGRLLLEALGVAPDAGAPGPSARRVATALALVRRDRRAPVDDAATDAERWAEMSLGLSAYVGRRCAARLGAPLLDGPWAACLESLGTVAAETRAAAAGRGLAHLLDALGREGALSGRGDGDWRAEVEAASANLDDALERRVSFDGGDRDDAAVTGALRRHGYDRLLRMERARAEEAQRARLALVEEILRGPGTLVVCEVGALGTPRVESPRPAEAVNAGLLLYREGGAFRYSSGVAVEASGTAVAHDRRSGLLQLRVRSALAFRGAGRSIEPQAMAFEDGLSLAVEGLRIQARSGEIHPIDGGYLLRLAR